MWNSFTPWYYFISTDWKVAVREIQAILFYCRWKKSVNGGSRRVRGRVTQQECAHTPQRTKACPIWWFFSENWHNIRITVHDDGKSWIRHLKETCFCALFIPLFWIPSRRKMRSLELNAMLSPNNIFNPQFDFPIDWLRGDKKYKVPGWCTCISIMQSELWLEARVIA